MERKKEQILYVAGALLILAVLYFGFDTKPSSQQALEKSRALSENTVDIHTLEKEARTHLDANLTANVDALQARLQLAQTDSARLESLKALSGFWYQQNHPMLSGAYAMQVAEINQDADSWSIAGTTFAAAFKQPDPDDNVKALARDQAIAAFEKAISLEPGVIEHRINQALCYIEAPVTDQPMKGIQMLAGLATKYPESALPPFHLARLAVQTGQMEKAEERIEQALAADSTNQRIACLAGDIYRSNNKPELAEKMERRCLGQ